MIKNKLTNNSVKRDFIKKEVLVQEIKTFIEGGDNINHNIICLILSISNFNSDKTTIDDESIEQYYNHVIATQLKSVVDSMDSKKNTQKLKEVLNDKKLTNLIFITPYRTFLENIKLNYSVDLSKFDSLLITAFNNKNILTLVNYKDTLFWKGLLAVKNKSLLASKNQKSQLINTKRMHEGYADSIIQSVRNLTPSSPNKNSIKDSPTTSGSAKLPITINKNTEIRPLSPTDNKEDKDHNKIEEINPNNTKDETEVIDSMSESTDEGPNDSIKMGESDLEDEKGEDNARLAKENERKSGGCDEIDEEGHKEYKRLSLNKSTFFPPTPRPLGTLIAMTDLDVILEYIKTHYSTEDFKIHYKYLAEGKMDELWFKLNEIAIKMAISRIPNYYIQSNRQEEAITNKIIENIIASPLIQAPAESLQNAFSNFAQMMTRLESVAAELSQGRINQQGRDVINRNEFQIAPIQQPVRLQEAPLAPQVQLNRNPAPRPARRRIIEH